MNFTSHFLTLEFQIEKIVLFLLEQQGVLANRLSDIGQEHQNLLLQPNNSKTYELQEDYRNVGRDLLRLLHFVEINATGLRKILKKFDKRFGYKFTDYYVKTRANHPYSQLRQVLRHVVMFLTQNATVFNFFFKPFEADIYILLNVTTLLLQNLRWCDVLASFCVLFSVALTLLVENVSEGVRH